MSSSRPVSDPCNRCGGFGVDMGVRIRETEDVVADALIVVATDEWVSAG